MIKVGGSHRGRSVAQFFHRRRTRPLPVPLFWLFPDPVQYRGPSSYIRASVVCDPCSPCSAARVKPLHRPLRHFVRRSPPSMCMNPSPCWASAWSCSAAVFHPPVGGNPGWPTVPRPFLVHDGAPVLGICITFFLQAERGFAGPGKKCLASNAMMPLAKSISSVWHVISKRDSHRD